MMAPGAVIRLEGLPFRVSKEELVEFFNDCTIHNGTEGIHLILNKEGRASGLGYVELATQEDVAPALDRDERNIGRHNRYAKIRQCDLDELEFYKKKANKDLEKKAFRLRMQGMPFRVSEYEIARWFEPQANCADVEIHLNSEGKPSGEATAYFETSETAEAAMAKDREEMGGRYINLTMENSGKPLSKEGFYVRMSGLPFRATNEEMIDFFKPLADCVSVRVILNREGRASGDAIAEFETEEDADAALKKNREHLGARFIILSREYSAVDNGSQGGGRNDGSGNAGKFSLRMGGLPYRTSEKEICDWFEEEARCSFVRIILNRDGRPSGEAIAEFDSMEEAEKAMVKNRAYLGDRFVILTPQY